jgi:hypothetical protein
VTERRFPPPWSVEEIAAISFVSGDTLACVRLRTWLFNTFESIPGGETWMRMI